MCAGLVGEDRNAQPVYLAVMSQLLDDPVSLAVKGLSSRGKSYTVESVLKLVPPDSVLVMTAMSERALIYMNEDLAHRTIVLYEAVALREEREKTGSRNVAGVPKDIIRHGPPVTGRPQATVNFVCFAQIYRGCLFRSNNDNTHCGLLTSAHFVGGNPRNITDESLRGPSRMGEGKQLAEIQYMVLADSVNPYLLARVRFPDVAQAVSAARPEWQHDPGLFDLPYDPSSATVTYARAAAIAAEWGANIALDTTEAVPSLIRRMPANWSNLVSAEKHAWGLERALARRGTAGVRNRLRSLFRAKSSSRVLATEPEETHRSAGDLALTQSPASDSNGTTKRDAIAADRRVHERTSVLGRVQLRCGQQIVTALLVNISSGGVRCVVPEGQAVVKLGVELASPVLLEDRTGRSRVSLEATAVVAWDNDVGFAKQFGVAFSELSEAQMQQIDHFLAAVERRH